MSEKKRILITGSQGFIGRALTLPLQNAGYEVWGVDRSGTKEDSHTIHADLLDLQQTIKALDAAPPFTALIHTAALAHNQKPPKGETCLTVNTKITDNILQAEGKKVKRLIFFSSVSVYGEDERGGPISVNEQLRPSSDYGKSKVLCEENILKSDIEHCDILRLAPVYDREHMNDVRKRVFFPGVSSFKMKLIPPPYHSLCHIDTVIKTVLNLIDHQPFGRRIFNVADDNPYSQHKLATWFPDKAKTIPANILQPFYWSMKLFRGNRGYALRCLYWKLFKSNIYMTDFKTLE